MLNPQYGSQARMNHIELNGKSRVNISNLEMVNAHDDPVLLAGYSNGGVVVIRDFTEKSTLRVVAAWNCLRELESHRRLQQLSTASSLIAAAAVAKSSWCQYRSTLAMGSDCRIIRLWDAKKEMRIMDLFTEDSSGAVTSLHYAPTTSASSLADLLIAGFTGGSVKIFDAREWGRAPILKLDDLQGSPILDAKIQDCGGQNILLAGNAGGNIKMYDVRMPIQAVNIGSREMSLGHNVSSIAIHPRFGVMASWAQQQQLVSIHTLDQDKGTCHLLNCVKYHEEGVLGVKLGAESGCLRFHPYLLQLAVASRDGAITVKGLRKTI